MHLNGSVNFLIKHARSCLFHITLAAYIQLFMISKSETHLVALGLIRPSKFKALSHEITFGILSFFVCVSN